MSIRHVKRAWSRDWRIVALGLERLKLRWSVVLIHWAIRRHHLARTGILLGGLRRRLVNRRTTVLGGGLGVLNSRLLADGRRLFIVRLLVALVSHVSVGLSHVMALVILSLLRLMRIRSLRRLHQGSGWLRRSILTLVLALA